MWVDVDATELLKLRSELKAKDPENTPSLLALIARFTVAGLRKFPQLNARVDTAEDGSRTITPVSYTHLDVYKRQPYDDETVAASVRRTGRAVVVAESQGFASVASEIAARTQERCFHSLAAPVLRVTGFDIPYPSPSFEHHHIPSSERILDALDDLQWED